MPEVHLLLPRDHTDEEIRLAGGLAAALNVASLQVTWSEASGYVVPELRGLLCPSGTPRVIGRRRSGGLVGMLRARRR